MKRPLLIFSLFCLFASCTNEKTKDHFYSDTKWRYFHFVEKGDSIHGYQYDIYGRHKDSLVGLFQNDSLKFTRIDLSNGVGSGNYYGAQNGLGFWFAADSMRLDPVSEKEFRRVVDSALHPKLLHFNKRLKKGDYTFEIDVKDWDPNEYKGLTTVKVFDQNGTYPQRFQSKEFEFATEKHLDFTYADFNFDGRNDLAFFTGAMGNRGTYVANYYLFDQKTGRFYYSEALSSAASGMGTTWDNKRKRIISESSGAGEYDLDIYLVKDTILTHSRKFRVNYWKSGLAFGKVLVTHISYQNGTEKSTFDTVPEKKLDYEKRKRQFLEK